MQRLQSLGLGVAALLAAAGFAFAGFAFAGQSQYGSAADGITVTYDDAQWTASELANLPYFECTAADCTATSCLVLVSLSPDFAKWPETVDDAALAALTDIFLNYQKSGGHPEAEVIQPMQSVKIGSHEALTAVVGTKLMGNWQSSLTMFREAGDTRGVTCEGDAESMSASKDRIAALIAGMVFSN